MKQNKLVESIYVKVDEAIIYKTPIDMDQDDEPAINQQEEELREEEEQGQEEE